MQQHVLWGGVVLLLLFFSSVDTKSIRRVPSEWKLHDPKPDPQAVVLYQGRARFTVLTAQMIRLEWNANGAFQDAATFAVLNRRLPVPKFRSWTDAGWFYLETQYLLLKYSASAPTFDATNLFIQVKSLGVTWNMSSPKTGNLLGTIRTLDNVAGSIELRCDMQPRRDLHCAYGLISRDGWTVVDDSATPLFDGDSQWNWAVQRPNLGPDWYFMGYGHDYKSALYDFTKIAGKIPLPPKYVFGVWFSRYWAYSDDEFRGIVAEYDKHKIPLDVLVVDMDWHYTFYKEAAHGDKDQAGQTPGWTGFTWDPHLFPDPNGFLNFVNSRGIKKTMNIHPASGIQPHEERYAQMARAMGIDPATKKYVPYDLQNKTFANNWLNIMLEPIWQGDAHPGADFFWLDWQQGEDWTSIPGVNPTFWLNYVFWSNTNLWKSNQRHLIFHRWGGLGNHRYQIGFSGDTFPSWSSLAFQPYFTSTASNVGYAFWSHDIGGHQTACEPELYTRWVQWGVFSPIVRTHCTKNPANDRRIWAYPLDNFLVMRDAMTLRFQFLPYIYSAARKTYDSGIAFLRGLYYDYPEEQNAYDFPYEYMFGDDILAAPVVSAMDPELNVTRHNVWLPPNDKWVDFFTLKVYDGGQTIVRSVTLQEIPIFVKLGAVIPLRRVPDDGNMVGLNRDSATDLVIDVFAGDSAKGSGRLYEDDSATEGYASGEFGWTTISFEKTSDGKKMKITTAPPDGKFPGMPTSRSYEFRVFGSYPASSMSSSSKDATLSYCPYRLAAVVKVPNYPVSQALTIDLTFNDASSPILLNGFMGRVLRAQSVKAIIDSQFPKIWQEDFTSTLSMGETANRIKRDISTLSTELKGFDALAAAAMNEISSSADFDPVLKRRALKWLEAF